MGWSIAKIRAARPSRLTARGGVTVQIAWNREFTWPHPDNPEIRYAGCGICAKVVGVPGDGDATAAVRYAQAVGSAWQGKPVSVNGIADDGGSLDRALDGLFDTGRAYRAYVAGVEDYRRRTLEELRTAGAVYVAARTRGGLFAAHVRGAERTRVDLTRRALGQGLLTRAEITEAARLTADESTRLRPWSVGQPPPVLYLDVEGFAQRLGVTTVTLRAYCARKTVPRRDLGTRAEPRWTTTTADAVQAERRQRGIRPLLGPY